MKTQIFFFEYFEEKKFCLTKLIFPKRWKNIEYNFFPFKYLFKKEALNFHLAQIAIDNIENPIFGEFWKVTKNTLAVMGK